MNHTDIDIKAIVEPVRGNTKKYCEFGFYHDENNAPTGKYRARVGVETGDPAATVDCSSLSEQRCYGYVEHVAGKKLQVSYLDGSDAESNTVILGDL